MIDHRNINLNYIMVFNCRIASVLILYSAYYLCFTVARNFYTRRKNNYHNNIARALYDN